MNLSVKIDFYTGSTNQPEFILEPQWWNKEELLATQAFELQLLNGYKKYSLVLGRQDLKNIQAQQLRYSNNSLLTTNERIAHDQLQSLLNTAQPFQKIEITI